MTPQERRAAAKTDPRVLAIRADKLVGRGTCSVIDECREDHELVEDLDTEKVTEPIEAVKLMREIHLSWLEQGTNATSGEEGCPLVREYKRFKEALEQNPL